MEQRRDSSFAGQGADERRLRVNQRSLFAVTVAGRNVLACSLGLQRDLFRLVNEDVQVHVLAADKRGAMQNDARFRGTVLFLRAKDFICKIDFLFLRAPWSLRHVGRLRDVEAA